MKIAFIVEFPTQFEVPFYQYIQKQKELGRHDIEFDVIYNYTDQKDYVDHELGKSVKWGFNLYEGYPHFVADKRDIVVSIRKQLESRKYDFIILNGYKNSYRGLSELCVSLNIPIGLRIDSVLNNLPLLKRILKRVYLPTVYKRFDHFFAVGSETRKFLHWLGYMDHRISYFSYTTDDERFRRQSTDGLKIDVLRKEHGFQSETIILSVAKFIEREAPWDILKAFIDLNRTDLALILVGDGKSKAKLKATASKHPHLKIVFPGYISYSELGYYYGLANIFVHAAKNEPWGVSVQEALSSGCTVITSDKVGASVDLIDIGMNGFIYKYSNISELKSYLIKSFALNSEKRNQITKIRLSGWSYEEMWRQIQTAARKYIANNNYLKS